MTTAGVVHLRPQGVRREGGVPSITLGTMLFVCCELMFFAALISAHAIGRANLPMWPPLDQPRLPIESTAFNTLVLLLSGVLVTVGGRRIESEDLSGRRLLAWGTAAGLGFVLLQGVEWVRLLGQGLTMQSSAYGGFFYLIVGAHALHALGGLAALGWTLRAASTVGVSRDAMLAARLYWVFVVFLWPVLYWRVYL